MFFIIEKPSATIILDYSNVLFITVRKQDITFVVKEGERITVSLPQSETIESFIDRVQNAISSNTYIRLTKEVVK